MAPEGKRTAPLVLEANHLYPILFTFCSHVNPRIFLGPNSLASRPLGGAGNRHRAWWQGWAGRLSPGSRPHNLRALYGSRRSIRVMALALATPRLP